MEKIEYWVVTELWAKPNLPRISVRGGFGFFYTKLYIVEFNNS